MFEDVVDVSARTLSLDGIDFTLRFGYPYNLVDSPDIEPQHIHDQYEFYVNLSGDVSFLVDTQIYAIESGDVVIIKPNTLHKCIYNKSCKMEHFVLWLSIGEDSPLVSFIGKKEFIPIIRLDEEHKASLKLCLGRLHSMLVNRSENSNLMTTVLLMQFIGLLADAPSSVAPDTSGFPIKFRSVLEIIDQKFTELNSVEDIAKASFVAPSTLNRWFRENLHMTPYEFLEKKKFALAKQLLSSGVSVTEVGNRLGFCGTSYFISKFKRHFGETPLAYKHRSEQGIPKIDTKKNKK
ncbi:MAG: helix-turn-helix domain-containing protein [Clostridia bacterium]|nr:helix-turn-helix domain-containing protein [Clostridia bacterium]